MKTPAPPPDRLLVFGMSLQWEVSYIAYQDPPAGVPNRIPADPRADIDVVALVFALLKLQIDIRDPAIPEEFRQPLAQKCQNFRIKCYQAKFLQQTFDFFGGRGNLLDFGIEDRSPWIDLAPGFSPERIHFRQNDAPADIHPWVTEEIGIDAGFLATTNAKRGGASLPSVEAQQRDSTTKPGMTAPNSSKPSPNITDKTELIQSVLRSLEHAYGQARNLNDVLQER